MAELNRREFLRTSGAVVAGAAAISLSPQGSAQMNQPSSSRRTIKKAVGYGMIGEGATVLDKFKLLRDLGFDGVEMDSPSPINPDEINKASEESGIKVHGLVDSVHWQSTLSDADPAVRAKGVEALQTALRDGKRLGSTSVLLVPAVVNKAMSYDDAYSRSQAEIRKALPLAQETGVKIAIENVWNNFLLSPLEAARYIDEFNNPMIGWHFDVGNIVNYGWPEQWIRILGKRIIKLHIKEFSRAKRDKDGLWKGFDVELLEGDCDWPAVMKALDEIGYSTAAPGNWATAEIGGGDRTRLKKIAELMDRIFAS